MNKEVLISGWCAIFTWYEVFYLDTYVHKHYTDTSPSFFYSCEIKFCFLSFKNTRFSTTIFFSIITFVLALEKSLTSLSNSI
jgi:hypothetical protein